MNNALANNKKYVQLLATGKELFWKHGFKKVTIEEICKKAGVSKVTYYRYFQNKIELAKLVVDQAIDQGVADFKMVMEEKTTATEKIKKMILMKAEGTNDISVDFLQDFYNNPELGLSSYIEEKTALAWQTVIKVFKIAQEKGLFRKDFKPEFLFMLSQKMIDLTSDKNLLQLYRSPQDLILEMTNMITYGILPHE